MPPVPAVLVRNLVGHLPRGRDLELVVGFADNSSVAALGLMPEIA